MDAEFDVELGCEWQRCWSCAGDGVVGHDCGEDTCCCLNPEDNVPCDICDGKGGWEVEPVDESALPDSDESVNGGTK